jgi:AhpD family alkylhydroperoxidase
MRSPVDYKRAWPEGYRAMSALNQAVQSSGLEHPLLELVKIRASQLNGCAYCLDMHTLDARAAGETEQRLNLLAAWREAPVYSPRERAALAWTEALTLVAETHAPDDVYEEVRRHFSEDELVKLSWAVVVINAWNRIAVAFHLAAGQHQPRAPRQP